MSVWKYSGLVVEGSLSLKNFQCWNANHLRFFSTQLVRRVNPAPKLVLVDAVVLEYCYQRTAEA